MASAASQLLTSVRGVGKNAHVRHSGTATFPTGSSTCTVENVPFLTGKSIVTIQQLATATVRLIEIKASRTNGDRGTITVGTDNGGNSAATIAFSWCKEEA